MNAMVKAVGAEWIHIEDMNPDKKVMCLCADGSLPYRQLRKCMALKRSWFSSSLPYRQLRKLQTQNFVYDGCSLPYRQLRKTAIGFDAEDFMFTAI